MAVRRTQQERTAATTNDLLGAARAHFARDGYAAASVDAICVQAGITKGALYHHFRGKQALFQAVYEAEQHRLREAIAAAHHRCPDPWDGMYEGVRAFLGLSLEPGTQRITLLDAPGALGWPLMREIRADCRRMTERGLVQAYGDGPPPAPELEAQVALLYGAQCESAMAIAHAPEPAGRQEAALAQFRLLLDALRAGAGRGASA
ncbi:TetR/AcrR family transcriptional regulator [Streptomyces sp. NPDC051940]|uniref:TetR/AcrR family transcriptional regulator n=1 Tax=Streptomyces sp. NPDC051940 TaxID=3155675 RepID=UPI003423ABDC